MINSCLISVLQSIACAKTIFLNVCWNEIVIGGWVGHALPSALQEAGSVMEPLLGMMQYSNLSEKTV